MGDCLNKKGTPASSPTQGNRTKGISNNSPIKQTGPKLAPPVQQTLASSCLRINFSANSRAGKFGRLFKAFSTKLATNYGGSRDFRRGTGLQTRVSCTTKSRTHPTTPAVFAHRVREDRLRGCYLSKESKERHFEYGQTGFRSVFKLLVFGAQTGWEISPSNKSKGTECISEVRAFQNRRHSSSPRPALASGLARESQFERCLLCDPNLEGSHEIPSIFLEGFSPRICTPQKVLLCSTQTLAFLGFIVNTQAMTLFLPDCKVECIKSYCSYILVLHKVSARDVSQLIGKLIASIQAIFPGPCITIISST